MHPPRWRPAPHRAHSGPCAGREPQAAWSAPPSNRLRRPRLPTGYGRPHRCRAAASRAVPRPGHHRFHCRSAGRARRGRHFGPPTPPRRGHRRTPLTPHRVAISRRRCRTPPCRPRGCRRNRDDRPPRWSRPRRRACTPAAIRRFRRPRRRTPDHCRGGRWCRPRRDHRPPRRRDRNRSAAGRR